VRLRRQCPDGAQRVIILLLDVGHVNDAPTRASVNQQKFVVNVWISAPAWSVSAEKRFSDPGVTHGRRTPVRRTEALARFCWRPII
jgi:hypothetical protein